MSQLRERLRDGIMDQLDEVVPERPSRAAAAGQPQLSFAYVEGEALMMGIKDVAVSSGSACTSPASSRRYVLQALGVGDDLAHTRSASASAGSTPRRKSTSSSIASIEVVKQAPRDVARSTRWPRKASTSRPSQWAAPS